MIKLLPLEGHGIEQWHLNKIWEYPEIVSEIDKISKMEVQDLQENELSVTLDILELIDQIEDEEIRNSANRLLQLLINRKVEYYEKRKDYLTENDGESLKLELVTFRDTLLELGDDFEFTKRDIDSILSIDKPYDILHGEYRNIKSPELKMFLGYQFKLYENISRCAYFLKILHMRYYFLETDPSLPFGRVKEQLREKQRQTFRDYLTKIKNFNLTEFNNEFTSVKILINEFSEILEELKKLRERMSAVYEPLRARLIKVDKNKLFDILNKKLK